MNATTQPGDPGAAKFGGPANDIAANCREWAAEFREQAHPVTLTLFAAAQTLTDLDAKFERCATQCGQTIIQRNALADGLEKAIATLEDARSAFELFGKATAAQAMKIAVRELCAVRWPDGRPYPQPPATP